MEVYIKEDPVELGKAAGSVAADLIKKAIDKKGKITEMEQFLTHPH